MVWLMLLLLAILGGPPVNAQPYLKGGVEHSERLAPLDNRLQKGKVFDPGRFGQAAPTYQWYKIPDWLAGLWYTTKETSQLRSLQTGVVTSHQYPRHDKHLFGMQQDASGSIWHCVVLPRRHVVSAEPFVEYRLETARGFPTITADEVATVYRFAAVQVDEATGLIIDAHQQESIMRIRPVDGNRLEVLGSLRTYDHEGIPQSEGRTYLTFFRAKPYSEVPTYRNEDMRQSFRQYLTSHNLSNLLPAAKPQIDSP